MGPKERRESRERNCFVRGFRTDQLLVTIT